MYRKLHEIYDTFKGISRKRNEDKVLIIKGDSCNLYVLFDGLGSANDADLGVRIASHYIESRYSKYFNRAGLSISEMMWDVHNSLIESELHDPYTTYVALYVPIADEPMKYSNLGDSRLYGITKNYIHQYSEDDSVSRHIVTKCLGMKELTKKDFTEHEINYTDWRYLLCTDGFYTLLEQEVDRFYHLLNFTYLATLKRKLRETIQDRNPDDSSYILIEKDV